MDGQNLSALSRCQLCPRDDTNYRAGMMRPGWALALDRDPLEPDCFFSRLLGQPAVPLGRNRAGTAPAQAPSTLAPAQLSQIPTVTFVPFIRGRWHLSKETQSSDQFPPGSAPTGRAAENRRQGWGSQCRGREPEGCWTHRARADLALRGAPTPHPDPLLPTGAERQEGYSLTAAQEPRD